MVWLRAPTALNQITAVNTFIIARNPRRADCFDTNAGAFLVIKVVIIHLFLNSIFHPRLLFVSSPEILDNNCRRTQVLFLAQNNSQSSGIVLILSLRSIVFTFPHFDCRFNSTISLSPSLSCSSQCLRTGETKLT